MRGLCWQHRLSGVCKTTITRHGGPPGYFCFRRGASFSSAPKRDERSQITGRLRLVVGAAVALGTGVIIWTFLISNSRTRASPLDPETFTLFTIISKEGTSSTSSIFTLKPSTFAGTSSQYSDAFKKGVWSVQAKQPQLQIARSYSPLPPALGEHQLRFLIRWEAQGEVSSYLHRLPLNATVELRGPHIEYEIPEDVDEVLFLAGGTGITPALQTAYHLFECRENADSVPKLHILWANRRSEESLGGISDTTRSSRNSSWDWGSFFRTAAGSSVKSQVHPNVSKSPIVEELEALKGRKLGYVTVDYFVDEEGRYITEDVLQSHFKDSGTSSGQSTSPRKKLIMLSGPEGFIKQFAGHKVWAGGKELQGPLGGTLGNINPSGWEIWKL